MMIQAAKRIDRELGVEIGRYKLDSAADFDDYVALENILKPTGGHRGVIPGI